MNKDEYKINLIYEQIVSNKDPDKDPEDSRYFRGVSKEELRIILKTKKFLPSTDLMPFDNEVIEYAIGEEYSDMTEKQIERWIRSMIPWYNGKLSSVQGGVNLTTDFENAKGYGDYVLATNGDGAEIADISDAHSFAKDANELTIDGIYDIDNRIWKYI